MEKCALQKLMPTTAERCLHVHILQLSNNQQYSSKYYWKQMNHATWYRQLIHHTYTLPLLQLQTQLIS